MICPVSMSIDKHAEKLSIQQEIEEQIYRRADEILLDFDEQNQTREWDDIWDYLDCEEYRIAVARRDIKKMQQIEHESALKMARKEIQE